MSGTSTYVQLSNFALVEYIYDNQIISTTVAKPYRLKNGYIDEYQFVNASTAINRTGNVLDRSASKLGNNTNLWAYHDIDSPSPIIQIDSNFTLADLTPSVLSNQRYDTVRVHLVAGYDLPGLDGIIVELQWEEWRIEGAGGRKFSPGTQVYLKSEQTINFNTSPLFLGDRFYDRYVEFKVPALAYVNEDFWNSPNATNTLGYQYTFNNVGFLPESQIFLNIYEIDQTVEERGNKYFQTGNVYRSSFNAADQYSYVGCEVKENEEFDFIEYYPTYNGGYIEDYIANLNAAPGGDWIVINQLNVYEQAGTNLIRTSSNTLLQEGNFNESSIFRPVIRNAAYVYSFTVEYIMRLLNKVNNTEIVRKSTVTSNNPKKYGYSLEKINLLDGFRPVKVYNKIERIDSNAVNNSILSNIGAYGFETPKIITQNVYVNNYFDVNHISVDSTTSITDTLGQTVYPQGTNYIFLNKFDNYVKFKVYTKSQDKKQNVAFNFNSTGMNVKLCFIYDDETKIYLNPLDDKIAADPGFGELLFRIDDSISTRLLNSKTREYYLINKNDKGDEVLIYSGKFESQGKRIDILSQLNQTVIDDLNKKIKELQKAQNSLLNPVVTPVTAGTTGPSAISDSTGTTGTTGTSNLPKKFSELQEAKKIDEATTYISAESKGIDNAIKTAAAEDSAEKPADSYLNIPDVPGVTPSMGASITLAAQPRVIRPSSPYADNELYVRLNEGDIKNIVQEL